MSIVPDKTVKVTVNLNDGRTEELTITVPADKISQELIYDTAAAMHGADNIDSIKIHD